jgi:DNA-directed RNA polymerase specialized sigma24 family protein
MDCHRAPSYTEKEAAVGADQDDPCASVLSSFAAAWVVAAEGEMWTEEELSYYAELLRQVDLESKSIADVSKQLGITANNTRVKLHRARAALREQLVLSCGSCTEHGCLHCTCSRPSEAP